MRPSQSPPPTPSPSFPSSSSTPETSASPPPASTAPAPSAPSSSSALAAPTSSCTSAARRPYSPGLRAPSALTRSTHTVRSPTTRKKGWSSVKLIFSSSLTCSTASTLTVLSCGERSYEDPPTPRTEGEILAPSNVKAFTFSELKSASRNVRPDSLLGEGGFDYVFKAWIDEYTFVASKPGSGMVVDIKKLKPKGFQGHKEWLVQYLGQLHHPNIVKLIAYCSDGDNRLLVYEYMPKGSLENHLFKSKESYIEITTSGI